ncbi:MAG: hypothetical protein EXR33_04450 [Betaproteobacteria bacterium]|nr:hypothetical protein [Betaproteobacteria bacterium]
MNRSGLVLLAFAFLPQALAQPRPLFESHSAGLGGGKMDISIRETERRPRASVLDIDVRQIGSSVGSSFFILCSVRKLDRARGGTGHIVKLDDTPGRGQMLIGFLKSADEPPGNTDPAFAAAGSKAQVIELEQFGAICDPMM